MRANRVGTGTKTKVILALHHPVVISTGRSSIVRPLLSPLTVMGTLTQRGHDSKINIPIECSSKAVFAPAGRSPSPPQELELLSSIQVSPVVDKISFKIWVSKLSIVQDSELSIALQEARFRIKLVEEVVEDMAVEDTHTRRVVLSRTIGVVKGVEGTEEEDMVEDMAVGVIHTGSMRVV